MRARYFVPALAVALIAAPVRAVASDPADDLADEAVRVNPRLSTLELQVAALETKADAVQMWMDPMFMVEYSNFPVDSWAMGETPMTGVQIKLTQTIPFPGKNQRREATALAQAETKRLEQEELAVQLRGMVKRAYYNLVLVRDLKRLTTEHIEVVRRLEDRVRLRYEVGQGNQKDLLNLSLMRHKLTDELGEFDRQDAELTAMINGALHRDPKTPIATAATTASAEPLPEPSQLLALAQEHRPRLKVIEQKARALRLAADQADYERRPDFSVWVGYRFRRETEMDPGTDFMSIGAAIPIPLNYTGSFDAKKRHNLEMAAAVEESHKAALDEIATEIEKQLATRERATTKQKFYVEQLVPETNRALEAALLSYETGRSDFFSIYRNELDLIKFERAIAMARIQAIQAEVAIETQIGAPLDGGSPTTGKDGE
jgi:outer membrane protein TolC